MLNWGTLVPPIQLQSYFMPLINILAYTKDLDITLYLYMAFAFYGVFLLIRKLVFNR